MTAGFQDEMKSVLDEPLQELRETAELAKKSAMWNVNAIDTKPAYDDFGHAEVHQPDDPSPQRDG